MVLGSLKVSKRALIQREATQRLSKHLVVQALQSCGALDGKCLPHSSVVKAPLLARRGRRAVKSAFSSTRQTRERTQPPTAHNGTTHAKRKTHTGAHKEKARQNKKEMVGPTESNAVTWDRGGPKKGNRGEKPSTAKTRSLKQEQGQRKESLG